LSFGNIIRILCFAWCLTKKITKFERWKHVRHCGYMCRSCVTDNICSIYAIYSCLIIISPQSHVRRMVFDSTNHHRFSFGTLVSSCSNIEATEMTLTAPLGRTV
jgi:hypothetical protein